MIYRVRISAQLIEQIFRTGYTTRGVLTVIEGIPEEATLLHVRPQVDGITEILFGVTDGREDEELVDVRGRIETMETAPLVQLRKVADAARLFCEVTEGEMSELEGSESASIPAEFMLLHEAVKEL